MSVCFIKTTIGCLGLVGVVKNAQIEKGGFIITKSISYKRGKISEKTVTKKCYMQKKDDNII